MQAEYIKIMREMIKGKIKIASIKFYKDGWGIVSAIPSKLDTEGLMLDDSGSLILKGEMLNPVQGQECVTTATLVNDPKYGFQYKIISFAPYITVNEEDAVSKRMYLETIFTARQVDAMYHAVSDPFKALKENNIAELIKANGVGVKTAPLLIKKFEDNFSLSKLCSELGSYGLSNSMMRRLLSFYHSPDIVIQKVKENPYMLTEVGGIGFKTADEIALKGGMKKNDLRRISAYIVFKLTECGQQGDSYISFDQLTQSIFEELGTDYISYELIDSAIDAISDKLWISSDGSLIGLLEYYKLESNICNELLRIADSKSSELHYNNLDDRIREIESEQGWEFTDQQRKGIESVNDNCLTIINGLAGTGKSSVAAAVIKLFKDANSIACCLSGKAAARLGEIIGTDGSTIHRLLGYNPKFNGFTYTKNNQLFNNLIIIDEISMIGGSLFYSLLQAIKTGTKVLMLGDTGQLSAIGECNVASDIIMSGRLSLVTLDKIHRQGAKSAIITQSIKIRHGMQIIPRDYVGVDCRGELKDLLLDVYNDKAETASKMLEYFKAELRNNGNDILKVQMIAPMKTRGDTCTQALNTLAQEYYNPYRGQDSVELHRGLNGKFSIRVGDKIIITKNNYKDCYFADDELATGNEDSDVEVAPVPIFNGFIGIVTEIDAQSYMVVDMANVGKVVIPKDQFGIIDLAYAITVHKFQGAQTETVIFCVDYSSYTLLCRELVYTAVTRAQKKCILVAQNTALAHAIRTEKTAVRHTHLCNFLLA